MEGFLVCFWFRRFLECVVCVGFRLEPSNAAPWRRTSAVAAGGAEGVGYGYRTAVAGGVGG
jgi:hypothetical protein